MIPLFIPPAQLPDRLGCGILLALALILSLVLLRLSLKGGSLPGCGPDSPCDQVAKGRWSRIGPVPVSLLGALDYLALLICAVLSPRPWPAILALIILTFIAAAWFVFVQIALIRRICLYCTAAHFAAIGACLLLLQQAQSAQIPPARIAQPLLIGVCLGLLLILSQCLLRPRTYALTQPASSPTPPPTPQVHPQSPASSAPRRIHVMRDQISLSPHLWPVLGPRDARVILVDLLDYTCKDCRHMHNLLLGAIDHFSPHLAVIPMPVPMDPACNPHISRPNPHHRYACPIARTALALWKARPDAFPDFDAWLYADQTARTAEEAQTQARQLTSADALATALSDPWLEKRMNEAIAIYAAVGAGRIPNLLMPTAMIQGVVPDLPELIKILHQQLLPQEGFAMQHPPAPVV